MLIHGGDHAGYALEYGRLPLDFSANTNPLGTPSSVKRALALALDTLDAYPDPLCRALTHALSHHENIDPQWIRCGNGAADLIFRCVLALKPRRALLLAPTFAEYELALRAVQCNITFHGLSPDDNFQLTEDVLPLLHKDLDVLFLCQPNNPTGHTIEPELLRTIATKCVHNHIRLVVDECFVSLLNVDNPEYYSLKTLFPHSLIILKAFTKLYGLAGVRLGYLLCSDMEYLRKFDQCGQAWSVSALAQVAGIAALEAEDFVRESRLLLRQEAAFLRENLASVAPSLNIQLLGGEANFMFFHSTCTDLSERLKPRGILIRSCSNYRNLDHHYYRIAVRTRKDNLQLLDALASIAP